ncbi:Tigger transposable element-derived protein 7-like 11, partial [Homarus americanus]
KLELIKKLEFGVSVAQVCDDYGVKKQTAKDKLTAFALKYDIDGASAASARKHMKVLKDKELQEAVYMWFVQQHVCEVKIRGEEIAEAANNDGWLWRFRNRHGIRIIKLHGEVGSAQTEEVKPFRQKLNQLVKDEGFMMLMKWLFWRSLPNNTEAFNHEASTPGHKVSKERISALCCATANGMHRLKLAVVGKSMHPQMLKDCMRQLPVIYYHSENALFNRQRTLTNIKKYNIKSVIFNSAALWKDVKTSTLANSCKKLSLDTEPELNFEGFEVTDFHQMLHRGGENNITMEDVDVVGGK